MKNLDLKRFLRLEVGSVILVVFGLIMILNPDFGSAAVATILGWILVGAGAAGLLIGVLSWPGLGLGEIIGSGLILAAGIYMLSEPLMLASILGILLGLLLASQGLGAVRDALRMKRNGGMWIPGMVLAVVMLLAGLRLVVNPLTTSRVVMTVAGIIMICCGIGNLINHYKAETYIPAPDDIIDMDE